MIYKKAIGLLLIVIGAFFLARTLPVSAKSSQAQKFSVTYVLTIEHPETHILHVDAFFSHPPATLQLHILVPNTLTYLISMSPNETITYPFHVTNVEITNEQGRELSFVWNPRPGQWSYLTLNTQGASEIHLSYDVAVLHPSDVRVGWSAVRAESFLEAVMHFKQEGENLPVVEASR